MSELGLCSRREADEWIPRGWVLVDGKPVTELGSRVSPDASIEILQAARSEQGERVTVLLNKPMGYVSGQAEDGYEPAAVLFTAENQWSEDPTRKRFAPWQRKSLAPAGRLDIDSTGLLVLTQDGRVARALIGEDSNVEKEYLVRVQWHSPDGVVERKVSEVFPADQLELLRHGLSLDGVILKPAKVSWQNEEQLRFVLREGRKRRSAACANRSGWRWLASSACAWAASCWATFRQGSGASSGRSRSSEDSHRIAGVHRRHVPRQTGRQLAPRLSCGHANLQSSLFGGSSGNSTSVKPKRVKSRTRIGYRMPCRWSHSCCTTRAWKPSATRSMRPPIRS